MCILLRVLVSWLVVVSLVGAEDLHAPNFGAQPFNQLQISGNACGPAALLNAFRFGNENWQRALEAAAADTDKLRLSNTIRMYGLRPSAQLKGRTRWSRAGINVNDLVDLGNEMVKNRFLPELQSKVLIPEAGESGAKVLERAHDAFSRSLKKGLPPVIALRRMVWRGNAWVSVENHFVTILRVPQKLPGGATEFAVEYVDPWGGKRRQGVLRVPGPEVLVYGLTADFPGLDVGMKRVKAGEKSQLSLSATIGRW